MKNNKENLKTNPNDDNNNNIITKSNKEEKKNEKIKDKKENNNLKIKDEEDILDLEIKNNTNYNKANNDFIDKISKTEPNNYHNKRPNSNNQKNFSPNKQFSTISHIGNFNKINNYSNNINSVRMPFKNILHKKHNNIIKIKLSNKKNNKNNNNEIEIETRNRNKILKPLNTNHLILNLIKMFNKSERRNEVKVYESLSNNYNENTVRTQENYINSNRRPNSIYKKDLLLRNRRKHNKM